MKLIKTSQRNAAAQKLQLPYFHAKPPRLLCDFRRRGLLMWPIIVSKQRDKTKR